MLSTVFLFIKSFIYLKIINKRFWCNLSSLGVMHYVRCGDYIFLRFTTYLPEESRHLDAINFYSRLVTTNAIRHNFSCHLTDIWRENRWIPTFRNRIRTLVNGTNSNGIRTQLSDLSFRAIIYHPIHISNYTESGIPK